LLLWFKPGERAGLGFSGRGETNWSHILDDLGGLDEPVGLTSDHPPPHAAIVLEGPVGCPIQPGIAYPQQRRPDVRVTRPGSTRPD